MTRAAVAEPPPPVVAAPVAPSSLPQMLAPIPPSPRLFSALLGARERVKPAQLDALGQDGKPYSSAEAVIAAASKALRGSGLVLDPQAHLVVSRAGPGEYRGLYVLRTFLLVHVESGEWRPYYCEAPLDGSPANLGTAATKAMTSMLATLLRDLLLIPREKAEGEGIAPLPPAPAPTPPAPGSFAGIAFPVLVPEAGEEVAAPSSPSPSPLVEDLADGFAEFFGGPA